MYELGRMTSGSWWSCYTRVRLLVALFLPMLLLGHASANPHAKRLYDDLLSTYNRLIRPVANNSDTITVKMGLKLSQLIGVNMKSQIMTTNMWVEQEWSDYKLAWDPANYGGVQTLHVPSEHIWLPDIVLYNNADGNYEVTIMTKAMLRYDGRVLWRPPAIYKSYCEIDVEFFPFDQQTCFMKFGSWTYDGYMLDLQHLQQTPESNYVDYGIELNDYYISVEWDVMSVPAMRRERYYSCCEEPYPDIIFNITLRRKTLFYTVNLIIPCVGISCLSVLVFYLPSESGEKVSLCISILLSLTVFVLLLAEIIPPTSLTVPLLGKYLLFTMVLVTLSVMSTICVLNVNFRSPSTHKMSRWIRRVFIHFLPPLLFVMRPDKDENDADGGELEGDDDFDDPAVGGRRHRHSRHLDDLDGSDLQLPAPCSRYDLERYGEAALTSSTHLSHLSTPLEAGAFCSVHKGAAPFNQVKDPSLDYRLQNAIMGVRTITQHMTNKDAYEDIEADWQYVAMVLDRLFLWIFSLACVIGTCTILLQAPSLYDTTIPIDRLKSRVARDELTRMGPEQ